MNKRWLLALLPMVMACSSANRIPFEQYSVAMNLAVEADSSVYIGTDEKFNGVLWLNRVMQTEQVPVQSVKLIQNYGKYYLSANQFKNIWILERRKDGTTAKAKALDITPQDQTDVYTDISFSRYGSKDNAMIRFRYNNQQVFIDRKGGVHETYQ